MHSGDPSERPAFRRARFRLTAWYVCVLAVFFAGLGATVYLLQKRQLYQNINTGLRSTAQVAARDISKGNQTAFAALSGLRYHVVLTDGSRGVQPTSGLPDDPAARAAVRYGADMRDVQTPDGPIRVYSQRVYRPGLGPWAIQVARSLEPAQEALENLLAVLLIGSAGALVVAAAGGWFLAGKSLEPLRLAFDRQHAFVADASHELRTPLAVIRANAEFLQQGQPDSVEIADIVSETDRLSALVDALLALARGEAADRPQRDLFDLGSVVEGSVDAMRPLADERGVSLSVGAEHGVHVQGDREQLRQLIVILVDNALRYTPEGGSVGVDVMRSGNLAAVSVTDTGIGIEEAALRRVFDRFYRADDARNRDSGGAGLGGVLWQSAQSRITPYVVEVDKLGGVRAVGPAIEPYHPTDAQIAYYLAHFITDVRALSIDPVLVRQDWLEAYGYVTDHAAVFLNDYARANDPFKEVGQRSVAVQVTSVVRVSDDSFQVKWREQHYDHDSLAATTRWTAILTIVERQPANEEALRRNPLGIYVNGINWSRELNPGEVP